MTSVSLDRIARALGMTESKTQDTHIWATVSSINDDGSYQVRMNGAGASETTRAARLCNAYVGDRVLCVVSNGKVSAIGRVGGELNDWVKSWTLIAETVGTTSRAIDIYNAQEVLIAAKNSSGPTYLTATIPIQLIGDAQSEYRLTGGFSDNTTTGMQHANVKLSKTLFSPQWYYRNSQDATSISTFYLYAR